MSFGGFAEAQGPQRTMEYVYEFRGFRRGTGTSANNGICV